MKNKGAIVLVFILLISLVGNAVLFGRLKEQSLKDQQGVILFPNANSRETYFTMHHVKQAQSISNGNGIKVGILDHYFGYRQHKGLYSGGVDFVNDPNSLNNTSWHGYWMTNILREIAPGCQIYALNVASDNEDEQITAVIKAIDWAIDNHIDILTYSLGPPPISQTNRQRLDAAVDNAVKHDIVTTFIHYNNPNNIYPGLMNTGEPANLNIFPYDYNILFMSSYEKYEKHKVFKTGPGVGSEIPYFSTSSASPVTAGFVAILKGINNKLTPSEYKEILVNTSYKMTFTDPFLEISTNCAHVADIMKAITYMEEHYQ